MPALRCALSRDETGQAVVEYAMLVTSMAVFTIAILVTMGDQMNNIFTLTRDQLAVFPANGS